MSEPTAYCDDCKREKSPYEHRRADLPSEAAMNWLYRTCPFHKTDRERKVKRGSMSARACAIKYRAGFEVRGRVVGQ